MFVVVVDCFFIDFVLDISFSAVKMTDKSAQVKIGHYILGETLGVGTFGKVKSELNRSFVYGVWLKCPFATSNQLGVTLAILKTNIHSRYSIETLGKTLGLECSFLERHREGVILKADRKTARPHRLDDRILCGRAVAVGCAYGGPLYVRSCGSLVCGRRL